MKTLTHSKGFLFLGILLFLAFLVPVQASRIIGGDAGRINEYPIGWSGPYSVPDLLKETGSCPEINVPVCTGTLIEQGIDDQGCPLPPTCCGDGLCEGKEGRQNCPEDCIPQGHKTCAQQSGYACTEDQTCAGTTLPASDTNRCCSVSCTNSSYNTTKQTCTEQSGHPCSEGEVCLGTVLPASDTNFCCSATCTLCGNHACDPGETNETCPEDCPLQPHFECTSNRDCSGTQTCIQNNCQELSCPRGYAANHGCVDYECMEDKDCKSGSTCDLQLHICRETQASCQKDSDCAADEKCGSANRCVKTQYTFVFVPVNWGRSTAEFDQAANAHFQAFSHGLQLSHCLDTIKLINIPPCPVPVDSSCNLMAGDGREFDAMDECVKQQGINLNKNVDRIIGLTPQDIGIGQCGRKDVTGYTFPFDHVVLSEYDDPTTTAHEIGHTYGLCEEYSYQAHEQQNEDFKQFNDIGCLNTYPADCPTDTCQDVCCDGNPLPTGGYCYMGPSGVYTPDYEENDKTELNNMYTCSTTYTQERK